MAREASKQAGRRASKQIGTHPKKQGSRQASKARWRGGKGVRQADSHASVCGRQVSE